MSNRLLRPINKPRQQNIITNPNPNITPAPPFQGFLLFIQQQHQQQMLQLQQSHQQQIKQIKQIQQILNQQNNHHGRGRGHVRGCRHRHYCRICGRGRGRGRLRRFAGSGNRRFGGVVGVGSRDGVAGIGSRGNDVNRIHSEEVINSHIPIIRRASY